MLVQDHFPNYTPLSKTTVHPKIGGPFTPRRALLVSQATQRMLIICYVDDDDVDVDVVVDDVGVNLAMMLMILMLM